MKSNDNCSRNTNKPHNNSQIRPGYLRSAAAAHYMGISIRTLTNWVKARRVAQIKPSKRVSLFRIADLDSALTRFRSNAIGELL